MFNLTNIVTCYLFSSLLSIFDLLFASVILYSLIYFIIYYITGIRIYSFNTEYQMFKIYLTSVYYRIKIFLFNQEMRHVQIETEQLTVSSQYYVKQVLAFNNWFKILRELYIERKPIPIYGISRLGIPKLTLETYPSEDFLRYLQRKSEVTRLVLTLLTLITSVTCRYPVNPNR